jgi:hypothetical protein
VNTDFAEAEADDERVNLTRFPLFFPEQRQFFLERAGVFEFAQGETDRVFHSRCIGLTPDGSPLRLLGGARLVGRVSGWDLATLNMQTERAALLAGTNLGVLRLRRRVLNDYSSVGVVLTTRLGTDETRNYVAGADGSLRLTARDDYLVASWAHAAGSATRLQDGGLLPNDHLRLALERRTSIGGFYRVTATVVGAAYGGGGRRHGERAAAVQLS